MRRPVRVAAAVALVLAVGLAGTVERIHTAQLLGLLALSFAAYAWIGYSEEKNTNLFFWLGVAVVARLAMFVSLPHLSDDVYRFIWDGRLWLAGRHPLEAVPAEVVRWNLPGLDAALFHRLNSPDYFTVYPPVAQALFGFIAFASDSAQGSLLTLRLLVLLAEAGTVALLMRVLQHYQLPVQRVRWYALNPLIILEFTGNAHLEAFLIFFLTLFIWGWTQGRGWCMAVGLAGAIGVKLLPLMFLPLLGLAWGWRRGIPLLLAVGVLLGAMAWPMYEPHVVASFGTSLGLYFQKFEFNASLYYLLREYGFWRWGYNTVQSIGWKLAVVSAGLIVAYSFFEVFVRKFRMPANPASVLLFGYVVFVLFTTTVHPWYVAPLVALACLSRWRFPMVWSGVVMLTYAGYTADGYIESIPMTVGGYLVVFLYFGWESTWKSKKYSY